MARIGSVLLFGCLIRAACAGGGRAPTAAATASSLLAMSVSPRFFSFASSALSLLASSCTAVLDADAVFLASNAFLSFSTWSSALSWATVFPPPAPPCNHVSELLNLKLPGIVESEAAIKLQG